MLKGFIGDLIDELVDDSGLNMVSSHAQLAWRPIAIVLIGEEE